MYKIAIFGFGGRCINLFLELHKILTSNSNSPIIKIVAVYDSFYHEVMKKLSEEKKSKINYFMDNTNIYNESISEEKVYLENDFDLSFISSQNYKHYKSILFAIKYGKNIFCEKPIVNNLNDLTNLKKIMAESNYFQNKKFFQTGLTLRYTKMLKIASEHLNKLGKLNRIYGREFVNIGHAVHIMTSWRRYPELSGGLGLEKVVHDYDLLLYFIEKIFLIPIHNITISGIRSRVFWTKDNEREIMNTINNDKQLFDCFHKWASRIHQTLVNSPFDNLESREIIPDYQKINMYFNNEDVNLDFELSIGGYRTKTERFYVFEGINGKITIDIINNIMIVNLIDDQYVVNLEGDGTSHSGGDTYVMQTLLDLLRENSSIKNIPSFEEAIRATHIGLLCEDSIKNKIKYQYKSDLL